jgi:hypothetical protein
MSQPQVQGPINTKDVLLSELRCSEGFVTKDDKLYVLLDEVGETSQCVELDGCWDQVDIDSNTKVRRASINIEWSYE